MSEYPAQRPILSRKTTRSLIFLGTVGWTAFFLTTALWKRSNNKRNDSLTRLEQKSSALTTKLSQQAQKNTETSNSLEVLKKELAKKQQKLESFNKAAQSKLDLEVAKTASETAKYEQLLKSALSKVKEGKLTSAELDFWAKALEQAHSSDAKLKDSFHSQLAEQYFQLGEIEKTKSHLALSNKFDPEQESRLLSQLDIEVAIASAKEAIKKNVSESSIQRKLKTSYALIKELAQDPKKKTEANQLIAKLLRLESRHALNLPPKQALAGMLIALKKQRELTATKNAPLSLCVSYVQASLNSLLISQSLNNTAQTQTLNQETAKAIQRVLQRDPKNKQAYAAQSIIELMELDRIFLDASAATISKQITKVKATSALADLSNKIIITSAAAGHSASVAYERGKTTEASKILTKAIKNLASFCTENKQNALAQFRLGILYWHKAQLTTSKDENFQNLKLSEKTLTSSLSQGAKLYEHSIRQFLAMVQGDLGHLEASIGKKNQAKKHFQSALKNWKLLEQNWTKTNESKEGIRYCSWRIKQL